VLGFIACGALVRTEAFTAVGGFDPVVRFPGEEERLALDLSAAGWGISYVDSVTVHHHPSTARHSPAERQAAIWRSRLLTAVMRLPWADVLRIVREAVAAGASGRAGVRRAVPDISAALRRRRVVPRSVLDDLRRLRRAAEGDP
jgi:GT2 family glycosyltransferase